MDAFRWCNRWHHSSWSTAREGLYRDDLTSAETDIKNLGNGHINQRIGTQINWQRASESTIDDIRSFHTAQTPFRKIADFLKLPFTLVEKLIKTCWCLFVTSFWFLGEKCACVACPGTWLKFTAQAFWYHLYFFKFTYTFESQECYSNYKTCVTA